MYNKNKKNKQYQEGEKDSVKSLYWKDMNYNFLVNENQEGKWTPFMLII